MTGERFPHGLFAVYPDPATDGRYRTELNLHRHLPILAKAVLLTGDPRYTNELYQQWYSWQRQNPPLDDTFISDGLELAARVCSWTHSLQLLHLLNLKDEFLLDMGDMIRRYARLLEKNFNAAGSSNNHQVAEAFGMFFIGLLYPEYRHAHRLRIKGLEQLNEQAREQFYEDGVHKEQSSNYHMFVLECYLMALLCDRNSIEVPQSTRRRVERAAEYLFWLTKPDGRIPMLGNAGFKFFCPAGDPWFHPGTLLALAARVFHRPDMAISAGQVSEEAFWLLGRDGLERLHNLSGKGTKEKPKVSVFPHGGHGIVCSGEDNRAFFLHFDCGPQGLPPRAGHGHDDALSIELSALGQDYIVDPGTYTYLRTDPIRKHLRSARGHSGIIIDGHGPADPGTGMFGWDRTVNAKWLEAAADNELAWFRGCHEAYQDVWVERAILTVMDRYVLVLDIVKGNGNHSVETLFVLSPELQLEQPEPFLRFTAPRGALLVASAATHPSRVTLHRGADEIQSSWYAPRYGHVCETTTLRWLAAVELPYIRATALLPEPLHASGSLTVAFAEPRSAEAAQSVLTVTCHQLAVHDHFALRLADEPLSVLGIETAAVFTLIRSSSEGDRVHTYGDTFVHGAASHSSLKDLKQ